MAQQEKRPKGYTLIELLLALAILSVVILVMLNTFSAAYRGVTQAKNKLIATTVASEIQERIRNMPYDDIGTTTGWPQGTILSTQTIIRSTVQFSVTVKVDYIDDPFDGDALGTIQDKPVDTVPTDFKRVEVKVLWEGAQHGVVLTSRYAPRGVETATDSGSLFITVFNASGNPVPLADVTVTNDTLDPTISIQNTTDIEGRLQLLSLPPALESYHIVISKEGYSTDTTNPVTPQNPNPEKPDVSIIAQEVTEVSFSIDVLSTLDIATVDETCSPLGNIPFQVRGTKIKGSNPPQYKYNVAQQTDENGNLVIPDLEWDSYQLSLNTPGHDIAGFTPPNALNLLPGVYTNLSIILYPHQPHTLFLTVVDSGTDTPITGAQVHLTASGYDRTLVTGQGYLEQSDWSGGSGQTAFINPDQYSSDDGSVDGSVTTGQLMLASTQIANSFLESFTGTANLDSATTTADWNTGIGQLQLPKQGGSYIPSAIGQSVRLNSEPELITSATLTATDQTFGESITYYLAADGVSFEEVTPGDLHTFSAPGNDLRFKIILSTGNSNKTPVVEEVQVQATTVQFEASGTLESSTYDIGAAGEFSTIDWDPSFQISEVGADSIRIQIASNIDNTTWDFVGPDGTDQTYYTTPNTQVASVHDGDRYVRYKAYLRTEDVSHTPILSHIAIGYTSTCTPPGQVFFDDLSNETYTIDITQSVYETYSSTVDVQSTTVDTISLTPLP